MTGDPAGNLPADGGERLADAVRAAYAASDDDGHDSADLTARPSAREIWAGCTDNKGRLLRRLRSSAVEVRCSKGHLVAYLLRTPAGTLWVRRRPWVERDSQHGWEVDWAEEDGPQFGHCTCHKQWLMNPALVDWQRQTMHPVELRSEPAPGPTQGGDNPFFA